MEKMEITVQNVNIAVQLVSGIGTWKNGRKQCKQRCFSRVWGNKGIGNIVKNDVLERFLCKLPCFEGKRCKNMDIQFQKHGVWKILWKKMQSTVQNVVGQFFVVSSSCLLDIPQLGRNPCGGKYKRAPIEGEGNHSPGFFLGVVVVSI